MAKILIADDSLIARKSYESMLSGMGHEVVLSVDGRDAIEKFSLERPELLILDVDMPEVDGIAACREIRRDPNGLLTPIIIVSALDNENDIFRGLDAGANDYLIKPVKEAHLLTKLKNFLGIASLHKHDFELLKSATVFAGRYKIEKLLGLGVHASVFLASDQVKNNRQVALKLLRKNFASEDITRLLLDGARRLAEIDSPHIVKVLDTGQLTDRVYVVMELMSGGSLENILKSKLLSEFEATLLGYDLSCALKALEDKRIVHLDVKPGNILYGENYKLADFGVITPRNSGALPQSGEIWGTVAYVSPEYLTGGELTIKSDVYSLGITLYRAVTGDNPFDSDRPSVSMFRQMNLTPPPVTQFDPSISKYFSNTVQGMLDKDPESRPEPGELMEVFAGLDEYLRYSQAKQSVGGNDAVMAYSPEETHDPLRTTEIIIAAESNQLKKKIVRAKRHLDRLGAVKRFRNRHERLDFFRQFWDLNRYVKIKIILALILILLVTGGLGAVIYRILQTASSVSMSQSSSSRTFQSDSKSTNRFDSYGSGGSSTPRRRP